MKNHNLDAVSLPPDLYQEIKDYLQDRAIVSDVAARLLKELAKIESCPEVGQNDHDRNTH